MISKKLPLYTDLHIYLTIIATLILVGFLFIYSASSVFALETFGSAFFFVWRHLIGFCIGLVALCIGRLLPLRFIKNITPLMFFTSLMVTACTLIPSIARTVHGASRWISIAGFAFQPSEIIKITLLLYSAYFFEKQSMKKSISFNKLLLFYGLIGIMSLILLKQPDFGMTITLLVTIIIISFIAYGNIRYIVTTLVGLTISAIILIALRPYRIKRIATFLDPWQDPHGAGFQVIQSLIAIGSGHWLGIGIAHSRQKFFYLPMQHTDFIFSIIAEETGFIGCLFLIILFILFLYFGIRIAYQLQSTFCTLTVLGFTILITLQAVLNIAVTAGLAPTKGFGLPFISYGNTSLVCYFFMLGVIINMVYEANIRT